MNSNQTTLEGSRARKTRHRLTRAEAQEAWRFIADNDDTPAKRVAILLEHAARVRPKQAIPLTTVALITFGLDREPPPSSPLCAAIRNQLRCVERLLIKRGRALIRCGRGVRASTDRDDIRDVLHPRIVARARAAAHRLLWELETLPPHLVTNPDQKKWILRAVRGIPETFLSAEQRAFRLAWTTAAEGRAAGLS